MAPTLLIVDDHVGFRAFARALLEAEGFVVVGEAGTGEGAMRVALALEPQIVLVDVVLPDVDGFASPPLTEGDSPPIVVLTSSRDASTYRRRLASRARGFIPKNQLTGAALAALTTARRVRLDGRPDRCGAAAWRWPPSGRRTSPGTIVGLVVADGVVGFVLLCAAVVAGGDVRKAGSDG